MKKVFLYTDGACSGNPGMGGWAYILIYNENIKKESGFYRDTTNNRMELNAVIKGLGALKSKCNVNLYSDSNYVLKGANLWINNWIKNSWKGSNNKPVANQDLWKKYLVCSKLHEINFNWVKGHAGIKYNEMCDQMAKEEIKKRTK